MFLIKIWKYSRPTNLLVMWLTLVMVYFSMSEISDKILSVDKIYKLTLMSISVLSIASSGYWLNDFFDYEIDKINRKNMPLLLNIFSKKQVLVSCTIFNIMGIVALWYLGEIVFICCVPNIVCLLLYPMFKRIFLIGNLAVGYLCSTVIFIAYCVANETSLTFYSPKFLFYIFFSFLISLIREIIKDIEDIKGDARYGCTTMPIVLGISKVKLVIWFLLCLLAYFLLQFGYSASYYKLIYLCVLVLLPLFFIGIRLIAAKTKSDYTLLSKYCKIVMFTGLGSMIFN